MDPVNSSMLQVQDRYRKDSKPASLEQILKKRKTLWKEKSRQVWSFFCPLCRANRKVPYRSRPGGVKQTFQVFVAAAFFALVTWTWFDWKGIVSFVPLWAGFEIFYRTRTRAHLNCPHCGFDPYLYLVDIKRARKEIEDHWRKKFAENGVPFPEPEKPSSYRPTPQSPSKGPNSSKDALNALDSLDASADDSGSSHPSN